jgi:bifunctional DNA-binding transcriptional regulator/antitoxin component of YhaV-PrlF toxin-antitoxin module
MRNEETRVTRKYQTTIPKEIRKYLKVKPKETVSWHVLRSMVVVDSHKKVDDPVEFLTSQIKKSRRLEPDAVKLVNESREEFG